jgi:hypothetical protein
LASEKGGVNSGKASSAMVSVADALAAGHDQIPNYRPPLTRDRDRIDAMPPQNCRPPRTPWEPGEIERQLLQPRRGAAYPVREQIGINYNPGGTDVKMQSLSLAIGLRRKNGEGFAQVLQHQLGILDLGRVLCSADGEGVQP